MSPSKHYTKEVASVPGLPPRFDLPFAFTTIHRIEDRRKLKQGRPGSIHYVSGHEVDVGGEGPIFKYMRTKLESEFLTGQDE